MTRDAMKQAIMDAIKEHQENHAAVKESDIPQGLEGVVTGALTRALADKLARIFSA